VEKTVSAVEAVNEPQRLPAWVQEALGELAGAAKEGSGRSRSVAGACRSSARGCVPSTAAVRSGWRATRTSLTVTR
jgi:hypothetical protein